VLELEEKRFVSSFRSNVPARKETTNKVSSRGTWRLEEELRRRRSMKSKDSLRVVRLLLLVEGLPLSLLLSVPPDEVDCIAKKGREKKKGISDERERVCKRGIASNLHLTPAKRKRL